MVVVVVVVAGVMVVEAACRLLNETVPSSNLVFAQAVLTWLQYLLRKWNMILLQPAVVSHESRHFERLAIVPLELPTKASPLPKSHALPYEAARAHLVVCVRDWNRTTVAPETPSVLEHALLKWLHQPLP